MQTRQTKYATYAGLYVVIFVAILVVANFLANRYNKSYDATSNKRFSLSDQTLKILHDLKSDVQIDYFDKSTGFQGARDLLDRYTNASSKVHVKYIDILKNPGIARMDNIDREGTALVEMGSKKEQAKTFDEQGITGAMIREIKGGTRTVCNVEGNGEHRFDDTGKTGFSSLKDSVAKDNYAAKPLNLLQTAQVPADCTVLIVGGPTTDLVQPEVDAIKTYVENGGRALIMLDPPLKMGRAEISDNAALSALLTSWGVTPQKDLILDLNPVGQLMGLGPQVPLVTNYDTSPIVNELKGTATGFPLARSLEIKKVDKTSVDKLFSSSQSSFATTNLSSPEVKTDEKNDLKGPLVMAASVTYQTGKPNSQGRVVVVGNSGFAANSFIGFNGNKDLALNMMNWLSSDEDLISIRPKENDDRRITMTRSQLNTMILISQFGLPLAVVIAGALVWWRRR